MNVDTNIPTLEEIAEPNFKEHRYHYKPKYHNCIMDLIDVPHEDCHALVWDDEISIDYRKDLIVNSEEDPAMTIISYDSTRRTQWLSADLILPLPEKWIAERIEKEVDYDFWE